MQTNSTKEKTNTSNDEANYVKKALQVLITIFPSSFIDEPTDYG